MCRTVNSVIQIPICITQMVVRTFMTIVLMIEHVIKLVLTTIYNFISFLVQMISLIPICIVFILTSKLRCLCVGGSPCSARGGSDCTLTILILVSLFFIFKATGVLEKIFNKLGYSKNE